MNFIDRLILQAARTRGFVIGPAVVTGTDIAFGHDTESFSPAEYGDYIATSNGVYTCATLRADLLSSLPLKLYRLNSKGERTEVTAGNTQTLLQKVNPFWTFNRLIVMSEMALCLWGKSFWFVERGEGGRGVPREIWWARPDRVRVVPDPVDYIKGFLYRPANGGQEIPFAPSETLWMRFPNPLDEYNGLSPLAAARIQADYASAAWKSNKKLFENGIQAGGMIMPKEGAMTWTPEQAKDMEIDLSRRFKGVDKAHRWAVLRVEAQLKELGFNPKEAEFIQGIHLSLEEICRAYRIPLDLVGGQRTYENVDAAMEAVWTHAIIPEARFISAEITEQLLPMFAGEADLAEFDWSGVHVLQEDQASILEQMKALNQMGVPLNPLLKQFLPHLLPENGGYEWGDDWWAPISLVPINSAGAAQPEPQAKDGGLGDGANAGPDKTQAMLAPANVRQIEFGSAEHERLWQRFVRRSGPYEKRFGQIAAELFKRQKDSVLARLRGERGQRDANAAADEPFDMAEWTKKFRTSVRPMLAEIIGAAGESAIEDLALGMAFDVLEPRVVRFLERRAQRFARDVNQTTWDALKASLSEGVQKGEAITDLADRVEAIMGERIRSSGETIARTEVIGATNGGTLLAWQQSMVVKGKRWLAALDERTRETHRAAHDQTVKIDEDFIVGAGHGPAPGQIGLPEEDINCRCTLTAVLE